MSPTATAITTETPTPDTPAPTTSTVTPVVEPAVTCDTALSAAEYDQMAADGLTSRQVSPNANVDALMEDGGISCLWRVPNTDIEAWYAQWPSDQAAWDILRTDLLGAGATESTDGFAGVVQSDYNAELTYLDGTVYYVSPPRLLSSVIALQ